MQDYITKESLVTCDKPVSHAVARHDFDEGFCYPCVLNDAVSTLFREDAEYYLFYLSLNRMPATSNVTYANDMPFYYATAGAKSQVG